MATYPIKMLKDENGTPFVPLISLDSIQDTEGQSINEILDKKLETTNLIAGTQIELEVDGNNITISNSAEGTKLIDNLESEQAGVGALDARQGKVLLEKIPTIANNLNTPESDQALSAYQGYVLAGRVAPVGGATGQVLKKASDGDYSFEWGDAADPNAIVGDGSIMKIIELTYNEYLELEKNNSLAEDTEYHISDWNENERTYLTVQDIQELINNSTSNLQETLTNTQNELNTLKNSLAAEPLNDVITVVDSSLISLNTHTRLTKSGVMYVFDIGFKSESAFKAKTDYCVLQVSPYHYVPKEDASIQGFLRAGNDTPVSFWIHSDGYLDIYPMVDLPAGTYFSGQVSWIRYEEE